MKVFVDTSVWSLVLRKKNKTGDELLVQYELENLIREFRVVIIGPVRQEILSGISDHKNFIKMKEHLSYFADSPLSTEHYVQAAEFSNICRKKGVQGSHIDFLICSFAYSNNIPVFTFDNDFNSFRKYIDILLYKIRKNR
jgi:predicted nucleic acid-binding protein